jgi:hypothetical protein
MLQGGDLGQPAIVPGSAANSVLVQMIRGDHPDLRMPPEGDPLTAEQIRIVERWIDEGAAWSDASSPDATMPQHETGDEVGEGRGEHWAFRPLIYDMGTIGERNIDQFVDAKLSERGLSRSPPADSATLLRRLSLVLTGLPPTVKELHEFQSDPRGIDAAYESAVDRLLNSPHYGERWAQHWLDVIRWGETVGFETNLERPNAWPYRDWVINALNSDKPYDQFIVDQIAGDVTGQDAALGFLVSGPANLPGQIGRDEEAMRQARQDELDEVIGTVSQAFLALTVGCARCHNHKFDPITQRDYYAMQAIFAGLSYGERRWRGDQNDRWTEQAPAARQQLQEAKADLESLRIQHNLREPLSDLHHDLFDAMTITAVRMNIQATTDGGPASLYELHVWSAQNRDSSDTDQTSHESIEPRNVALASAGAVPSASSFALENQTRHFDNLIDGTADRRQAFPWIAESAGPAWVQIDLPQAERVDAISWDRGNSVPADYTIEVRDANSGKWLTVVDSIDRLPRLDDRRAAEQVRLKGLSAEQVTAITTAIRDVRRAQQELSRLSAGPQVYAASFAEPVEPTSLLHRGDPMQRRDVVVPAIPKVLGDLQLQAISTEPERRLALARHFADPSHPLTARVMVNRVWQHHFGQGLVDTPSDFGRMGSKPTHPELLDWLAATFIRDGWSLKRLHRRIVLSQAFRQSSRPNAHAMGIDADSRLLWRFPPRRLEAEAIRDSILATTGTLNTTAGGPGFNLFLQRGGLSGFTPIETFEADGLRRMIYAHKIRMQQVDVFGAFDCPDAGQMKPKRTRSITPTQSLGLLNSPFTLSQSQQLAERIEKEAGESELTKVEHAFLLVLSRPPNPEERATMIEFAQSHGLMQLCRVLLNTSEFLWIQ